MSEFTVYSIPGSPYGRAVLMTLAEKGTACRFVPVAPGEFRQEPHILRHPFGKVPVLEHDGFMIYETQAILRYLDRVLPTPSFTPADPKEAAVMDQLMNVVDWYFFKEVNGVIGFERIVKPRVLGGTPDEAAIAACLPRAHIVFNELGRILGDSRYFTGESMTLADLLAAPQLDFLVETQEWPILTANHPNIVAWLARMNARSSLQTTTWDRVVAMAKAA